MNITTRIAAAPRIVGLLGLGFWMAFGALLVAKKPDQPSALKPGMRVKLLREETLEFYGQAPRKAKIGESFEVVGVRKETERIVIGTRENGQVTGARVPISSVALDEEWVHAQRLERIAALFETVPRLKIIVSAPDMERLHKEPRTYVEAAVEEVGGKLHDHLALKLKGSAGSFQGIDGRPGFSFNCDKFKGAERFHGLKRFQLNNGQQDGTFLNELIAGEMARKAGVPASRCTHALVSLNGRDLGIYVLKEGFSDEFLETFFPRIDGNLYDGGFLSEIRPEMELDRGDPTHKERLKELLDTLGDNDQARQLDRLTKVIEVEPFLRYLAMENILAHWDGYSFNRNNYRIYENPDTGRFHFILHGMDQVFIDTGANVRRDPAAAVSAILWRNPAIRERYNAQLLDIYQKVLKPVDWGARVEAVGQRLMNTLQAADPERAKSYPQNITATRDRVNNRIKNIAQQMEALGLFKPPPPPPPPPALPVPALAVGGEESLAGKDWGAKSENAQCDERDLDGRCCLYIHVLGDSNASWRTTVSLPPGKYRFEAQIKVHGVVPLQSPTGEGAGLRVSGGSRQGLNGVSGDSDWQTLRFDFESNGNPVNLVAELRAKAGELWIDRKSLKATRLP